MSGCGARPACLQQECYQQPGLAGCTPAVCILCSCTCSWTAQTREHSGCFSQTDDFAVPASHLFLLTPSAPLKSSNGTFLSLATFHAGEYNCMVSHNISCHYTAHKTAALAFLEASISACSFYLGHTAFFLVSHTSYFKQCNYTHTRDGFCQS